MGLMSTSAVQERTVSEIRRLSTAGLEPAELLTRSARALHRAVPFDRYSAATIDPASNLITQTFDGKPDLAFKQQPANVTYFDRFYFQEGFDRTLGLLHQRRWAATLSDLTGGNLDLSLCYRDALKPAGLGDKLNAIFVDRVLWGDIELYRPAGSRSFTPDQVELVRRVAPLIGSGLRAAALQSRTVSLSGETDDLPGILILDQKLQVVSATSMAERLLAELGPLDPAWRDGSRLPVAIQVIVGRLEQSLGSHLAQDHLTPRLRVRGRSGRWLTLHASLTEPTLDRPAEWVVIISTARGEDIAWLTLVSYGLSTREEEVVKLVVGGLSTKQISDRLFIAEGTVQRHMSNIFEKVGVRSRRELVKELFFDQLLPAM